MLAGYEPDSGVTRDTTANRGSRVEARGYQRNREHLDVDRPKWGYPLRWKDYSRDQIEEVRRIQALLIELGPTLVEEGMLMK